MNKSKFKFAGHIMRATDDEIYKTDIVNRQLEKRDTPYFTLGDAILDGNMGL